MKRNRAKTLFIIHSSLSIILSSCSVSKQISKQANTILLKDSSIATGHIGISIYEPATGKYWYGHNDTHYFIPASNTKLFTLYAGMKYLGDSLPAAKIIEYADEIDVTATGDPTLLNSEYSFQPLYNFLAASSKYIWMTPSDWQANHLGKGWAWDDYSSDYMAERSALPVYGNLVTFSGKKDFIQFYPKVSKIEEITINSSDTGHDFISKVQRRIDQNIFDITLGASRPNKIQVPFHTSELLSFALLADTIKKRIGFFKDVFTNPVKIFTLHSQPSDSLFKPMMHRSDNFFAEQTLLMASNEHLGYMSDEKIIDTLLKTDLKDVPQRPKWVDGSGLSRYNLFTPKDFVYILNKMQNEFGLPRMKVILATGGEGTLSSYFKKDAGFIYAKTGTLSNNCALSGYLITNKGKLLIFSILANNYITAASPIRHAEERFLEYIREKY
jgi:D-alanyl-D-alanine carboxypeptidase/D-alanyl-D-alanine-endopeptidase (penicillin-binding protein 4)